MGEVMLTVALIADIHVGPRAYFDGQLRKLSHQALELTQHFVERMRQQIKPDLVVNLGDAIEDESPEVDQQRYGQALELLAQAPGKLVHVAGNHDRINLDDAALRRAWGMPPPGPLYYSFDLGFVHFVVLCSHERADRDVRLDRDQLGWLAADLGSTARPTVVLVHHSAADQDLSGNRWFAHAPELCLIEQRRELRALLRRSGKVMAVFNGHLHWNHLDLIDAIPYVTVQSVVENVRDDEPGLAAAAHAVVRITPKRMLVELGGVEPARYQFERLG